MTIIRCTLLFIMCLALLVNNQVPDENNHRELYDDYDYDSDDERYLVADDDRHNNGPNENNVTNNPTIFGFSRAPSLSPTVITLSPSPSVRPSSSLAPSVSPSMSISPSSSPSISISPSSSPSISISPTSSPSISPQPSISFPPSMLPSLQPSVSAKPSSVPTSMPSLDACKGYNGMFGNVNSDNKLRVSFTYGIETDMTIQNTLSSQIFNVEAELLNLLIQQLILWCQSSDTNFILAAGTMSDSPTFAPSMLNSINSSEETTENIVGLSSRPVDLPSGVKCLSSFQQADCNIVEGKMDVYLSPNVNTADTRSLLRRTIKSIMDLGLLNDCHPAILNVIWIESSSELVEAIENNELDDDGTDIDPISVGSMTTWMFIAGSVVFVMVVGVATRYRYYKMKDGKYDKEDGTESYIDVLTQNESVPSENRRASLQSNIPIWTTREERVPSVQSSRSSESSFRGFSWWDNTGREWPQSNDEEHLPTASPSRQQKIAEIRAKLRIMESDIGSHFSK